MEIWCVFFKMLWYGWWNMQVLLIQHIRFDSENSAVALKTLGSGLLTIDLCLNERKSEMIHITSKFRNTDSFPDLVTGDGSLKGSEYVRDLGVLIDKNLTFQQHIKNVCKSASFGIFKIGKIRKLLDRPTTAKLTHAFVSSHLDYCNSIFSGLPHSYLLPLQRIQNTAARLVTLSRKFEHITLILRSLHWLPIHHRTTFKVLLLIHTKFSMAKPLNIFQIWFPYVLLVL